MNQQELDIEKLFQCLSSFTSIALAISGGSDSIALMRLVKSWAELQENSGRPVPQIHILTVDHGLRPESQHEVAWVKQQAVKLGFSAEILRWQGEKTKTSIQEKARDARYQLMSEWCLSRNISAILTAHHLDDQAETVIMRLARGSGVDGLAAISKETTLYDITILRPLLEIPKTTLISYLNSLQADWIEDPSNEDIDFERVRVRKALPALQELGLEALPIARSAKRIGRANDALDHYTQHNLVQICRLEPEGYAVIDRLALLRLPEEISLRCLTRVIHIVGSKIKKPSMQKMEKFHKQILDDKREDASISGCIIKQIRNTLLITREVRRNELQKQMLVPGEQILWDHRFRVSSSIDTPGDTYIRLLTEQGYLALPGNPNENPVREDYLFNLAVRASLPSFWIGDKLISVPHLEYSAENLPKNMFSVDFIKKLDATK